MKEKQNLQTERWQKIAAVMKAEKLDMALICASSQDFGFGYSLTGLKPIIYHYLYLDKKNGKLNKGYLVPQSFVERLGLLGRPDVKIFDENLVTKYLAGFLLKYKKVGIVGPAPAIHFSQTAAELVFLDDRLWPILNRKSGAEIKAIASTSAILAKVLNKAGRLLQPGVRLDQMAELLDKEILKSASALAFPSMLESRRGARNMLYLLGFKAKVHPSDNVYINVGAELNGYFADAGKTFFINNPLLEKKYKLFEKAFDDFIRDLKPGQKLCSLPAILKLYFDRAGLKKIQLNDKYIGHGVGFSIQNMPFVGKDIFKEEILTADTTISFVVEAELDGQKFQLQDTVWIGEKKNEILTR